MSIPDEPIRPQASDGQAIIWLTLSVFIAVIVLALACGGGLIWLFGKSAILGDSARTEQDWQTDIQRRNFLQGFSPVIIPDSATNFKIEYHRVQETYLDATFTLSREDFAALEAVVRTASGEQGVTETYRLPGHRSVNDYATFTFNNERLLVNLEYIAP